MKHCPEYYKLFKIKLQQGIVEPAILLSESMVSHLSGNKIFEDSGLDLCQFQAYVTSFGRAQDSYALYLCLF